MRLSSTQIKIGITAWALTVAAAFVGVTWWEGRPGRAADAPLVFPTSTSIRPAEHHFTLVLVVHPRCACTRATVAELERLLARTGDAVDVWAVISYGARVPRGALMSGSRRALDRIPNVHVVDDPTGAESHAFGALTSGQVLLYDAHGQLAFAGGMTAGRGHEGTNDGTAAILDVVQHGAHGHRRAAVFGCGLGESTGAR